MAIFQSWLIKIFWRLWKSSYFLYLYKLYRPKSQNFKKRWQLQNQFKICSFASYRKDIGLVDEKRLGNYRDYLLGLKTSKKPTFSAQNQRGVVRMGGVSFSKGCIQTRIGDEILVILTWKFLSIFFRPFPRGVLLFFADKCASDLKTVTTRRHHPHQV